MDEGQESGGALPTVIVIGAMKCGTSALHRYLDAHPQAGMSQPKELNFFFGDADAPSSTPWERGNWHRGLDWYRSQFRPDVRVRGESSPGYTSPDHPEVPERIAQVVPDVHLLYLVRDPIDRAVSQWRHHRAEGTESRPVEEALLDPTSQYLARSRFHERLLPFLRHLPDARYTIVAQEELLTDRRATLRRLFEALAIDPTFWTDAYEGREHVTPGPPPQVPAGLRGRLAGELRDDAERLRGLVGRELPAWSV